MIKKLTSKLLDDAAMSKVVDGFDPEDYENTIEDEVFVTAAQLRNYKETLGVQLRELLDSCGANAIGDKIKATEAVIERLEEILKSRNFNDDDKICIELTTDQVNTLVDSQTQEEITETTEVVQSSEFIYYEVKYRVATVQEYNDATGENKSENDYLYELIVRLVNHSLTPAIRFAKKPLNDFVREGLRDEIINKNYEWETLPICMTISSVKFNSLFKSLTPEERLSLTSSHFVVVSTEEKRKSVVQLGLFDGVEATAIDLDNGGDINVEQ